MREDTEDSMKSRISRLSLFLAFLMGSSGLVNAQQNVGRITGVVRDQSGAVIPRVNVTASHVETGVVTEVSTNDLGIYTFPSATIGIYTIKASHLGFKTVARADVRV